MADGRGGFRAALRNRDFALMLSGFAVSAVGSWAYNIALWVYVWDQTESAAWVAAASLGRFVPALVFSTYGGVLAERFERTLVMRVCDLAAMVSMALLAVAVAVEGPVVVVIALAAVTSMSGAANDPAVAAMIPQVVGERDLAAANALRSTVDNVAVIAGPGLGALLLAVSSPSVAIALNAVTFGVSALLVSRMTARSQPTDVTEGGGAGVIAQMMVGFRAILTSSTAAVLVGFSVLATFVYGADTVLFVVLAERYDMGSGGVGWFLSGLGIGGVLAAGLVNRLAALPRLGVVITAGMAIYCIPTALLVFVDQVEVALGLQAVRGAGTLVVDVLAVTALQRALEPELVARVFGVFMALVLGAVSLGALVAPVILRVFGLDGALVIFGAGVPAAVLLTLPWLQRMDRAALQRVKELEPRIRVLEVLGVFAEAPRHVLERLAAAAEDVTLEPGAVLMNEGDPADALYIVASGDVAVSARGEARHERRVGTVRAPGYVGEVGLLERVPRTATVTALENTILWRIDGEDFLNALNEAPAAPAFVETSRARYLRLQPSRADRVSPLKPAT